MTHSRGSQISICIPKTIKASMKLDNICWLSLRDLKPVVWCHVVLSSRYLLCNLEAKAFCFRGYCRSKPTLLGFWSHQNTLRYSLRQVPLISYNLEDWASPIEFIRSWIWRTKVLVLPHSLLRSVFLENTLMTVWEWLLTSWLKLNYLKNKCKVTVTFSEVVGFPQ